MGVPGRCTGHVHQNGQERRKSDDPGTVKSQKVVVFRKSGQFPDELQKSGLESGKVVQNLRKVVQNLRPESEDQNLRPGYTEAWILRPGF